MILFCYQINQIGTVTEAIEVVKAAKDAGWGVVASHRIGETEDCFLADLAVGVGAGQMKAGAPCRSERLAKYNQVNCVHFFISVFPPILYRYSNFFFCQF